MKISINQNNTYLFADKPSKDIIVSLDIDTSVETSEVNNSEPIHYCFLLDISQSTREELLQVQDGTSSNGFETITKKNRIKLILKSFIQDTLPLFRDEDMISLVAYDTKPHSVFNGCKKKDKLKMLEQIKKLLQEDIKCEYNKLSDVLNKSIGLIDYYKYNKNKMIIITDTKPSFCRDGFGTIIDTEEAVLKATKNVATKNIALDCICIGSTNDEEKGDYDFAEKLVQASNGKAYTIEEPSLIKMHLSDSIKDSHDSSRYNGKLILLFNRGIELGNCYSTSPVNKFFGKVNIQEPNESIKNRHCIIDLPELKDNTNYNYLLEVSVPTVLSNEEKQNSNWQGFKKFKSIIAYVEYETMIDGKVTKVRAANNEIASKITHDVFRIGQEVRGDIDKNYKLATIKRLERDLINANKEGDIVKVSEAANGMCETYEELGMYLPAMRIKSYIEKVTQGERLNASDINTVVKTSSTARIGAGPTRKRPTMFENLGRK